MKDPVSMKESFIVNNIVINAPMAQVWDALVNPEKTKIYMFGCETVSEWTPGSSLIWRMDYEGKEFIAVKGTIIDFQPPHRLVYTVIDPNGAIPDLPENYLTVTYQLEEQGQGTLLTVTQGDYSMVADGERRYAESFNNGEGWNPILAQIKALVELNN